MQIGILFVTLGIMTANRKLKKCLKVLIWTMLGIVGLLVVSAGILMYVVVTPEKVTPIVQRLVNENLEAELSLEEVDVTFFSTFPRLGVRLQEGQLQVHDTTLLAFDRCQVEFKPLALLFKKHLLIQEIALDSARVFARRNAAGQANWEMIRSDSLSGQPSEPQPKSPELSIPGIRAIFLKELVLNGARLTYLDRTTGTSLRLRDLDTRLRIGMMERGALMGLDLSCASVSFRQGGQRWARRVSVDFHTKMGWRNETRTLRLTDASLGVNDLVLSLSGDLRPLDRKQVEVNLQVGAKAPSIEKMLALVPKHIMSQEGLKADGKMQIGGTVQGIYGPDQWPVITFGLTVEEASAKYDQLPYAIDYLAADFDVYLDRARNDTSFVDLKIFQLRGMNTDILLNAKLTDVFADPLLSVNTQAQVDLNAIRQTFPWTSAIELGGQVDTDLRVRTRLSTLRNSDYGKIFALGKLDTRDLVIRDTTSGFEVNSEANLRFIGGKSLGAKAQVNHIRLATSSLMANADSLFLHVKSERPTDTTQLFQVQADARLKRMMLGKGDSLRVFCRQGTVNARLEPRADRPNRQQLHFDMVADTVSGKIGDIRALLRHGEINLDASQINDTVWNPSAMLNFSEMNVRVPQLKLPLRFKKTEVAFKNRQLKLDQAHVRLGRSDVTLSGYLDRPYMSLVNGEKIRGKLQVDSRAIYVGQLLGAFQQVEAAAEGQQQGQLEGQQEGQQGGQQNGQQDGQVNWEQLEQEENRQREQLTLAEAAAEAAMQADTLPPPMRLIKIPDNLDIDIQTHLERVQYGALKLGNVQGKVEIKNSYVYLENLAFEATKGGSVKASMIYQAATSAHGYTGFELGLNNVDMGEVIKTLPALDSLVPMLSSLEGRVHLDFAAEGVLDSLMNIQIPSLRAAMNLRGQDLVLLEGDTFADIADLLMFKNKEKNLIEEISVNMIAEDGSVTVYPFVLQIDRYKAAAGGTQNLDMSFDYHISILESPLPFKAGVNVRGTPDDIDFGVARAKYKNEVSAEKIRRTDTLRMNYAEDITKRFKRVSERKKWNQRMNQRIPGTKNFKKQQSKSPQPIEKRTIATQSNDEKEMSKVQRGI